jgi:hypothetical protein
LRQTTRSLIDTHAGLAQRRTELPQARDDAAWTETLEIPLPAPLNPAGEGMWPADKPYFYLAKKRLREVGPPPFMGADRLSRESVILYGMTPAEKSATEQAYRDYVERSRQFGGFRVPTIGPPFDMHRQDRGKTSAANAARPEEIIALRQALKSAWGEILGEARTEFFWEWNLDYQCAARRPGLK